MSRASDLLTKLELKDIAIHGFTTIADAMSKADALTVKTHHQYRVKKNPDGLWYVYDATETA